MTTTILLSKSANLITVTANGEAIATVKDGDNLIGRTDRHLRAALDEPEGFDARKVADKVRDRLEAVGEWTDDDGVQLRMRDGRVERR